MEILLQLMQREDIRKDFELYSNLMMLTLLT